MTLGKVASEGLHYAVFEQTSRIVSLLGEEAGVQLYHGKLLTLFRALEENWNPPWQVGTEPEIGSVGSGEEAVDSEL